MCGISGIFRSVGGVDAGQITRLNDALVHRGPDDAGVWVSKDRKIGLGHRRLSIVDLSPTGKQPMHSGTGRFIAVYNGEIYNFRELRDDLMKLGQLFRGTSDTEVMLAAFEHWGVLESLGKMNGMFAAAVWDQRDAKLFLFRDRLGVKPLFYHFHNGALYWSSELSPVFSRLGGCEIDREALALYFRFNCIPAPRTIYQGICKLMPGVIATCSAEDIQRGRIGSEVSYWETEAELDRVYGQRSSMSEDEALELLDHGISRSVQQRMITDVPLGAFLSGGIDSSLVVSYMAKCSARPIQTFTIGFDDFEFDEAVAARKISEYLKTDHTEFHVGDREALDLIPSLPSIFGEPFADSSAIPTFLVSRLTRRSVTVALSGDGGDELFAGYNYYNTMAKIGRYCAVIPPQALVLLSRMLSYGMAPRLMELALGKRNWGRLTKVVRIAAGPLEARIPLEFDGYLASPETLVIGAPKGASLRLFRRCMGNLVEQSMCDDLMRYLPDDILTKVDRTSMANSLEVRAPFADDFQLLQAAWSIPYKYKRRSGAGGKLILKKLLARHLPVDLFERPKQGFGVPLVSWLNGPLLGWVESSTSERRLRNDGYLNSDVVAELKRRTAEGDVGYATSLWAVCVFQNWLDQVHRGTVSA